MHSEWWFWFWPSRKITRRWFTGALPMFLSVYLMIVDTSNTKMPCKWRLSEISPMVLLFRPQWYVNLVGGLERCLSTSGCQCRMPLLGGDMTIFSRRKRRRRVRVSVGSVDLGTYVRTMQTGLLRHSNFEFKVGSTARRADSSRILLLLIHFTTLIKLALECRRASVSYARISQS